MFVHLLRNDEYELKPHRSKYNLQFPTGSIMRMVHALKN